MDNSLKDKVLDAIDIVEVIGERVALTRKGKDYVGLCPFHPDHKPSFAVSPTKRIFKCWACGAGGDVIHFVQKYDRIEFREALTLLARRAGIELHSTPVDRQAGQLREQIQAIVTWARDHFRRNLESTPGGRRAREYALARGLTPETIERFAIGYAAEAWDDVFTAARRTGLSPETLQHAGLVVRNENGKVYDRFRHRLIFPIQDALGRPVAFGGRTLGDDPAKYLNSPETVLFSKSRILYGLDLARQAIQKLDAVIVVEGYVDAVLLSQYGFENVVATLGTALTDTHVKLLRPLAGTIYFCFDSDRAGIAAAERAVEVALRTQCQVRVVLLSDKDPADCVVASGAAGFQEHLTRAVDALEFRWSQALKAFGQGDQRHRRAAVEDFVQFVAGVTMTGGVDPLQGNLLVNRLSQLLSTPAEQISDLLARARQSLHRATTRPTTQPDGVSAYEVAIRGLPGGLVTAVESVLGLLLDEWKCWQWVDDIVARGTGHSETWERLYRVLLEVHQDIGEYSIGDVVARCEDGALCELVDRARARVAGSELTENGFRAAKESLASELNALSISDLRRGLQSASADDVSALAAFDALREKARGHREKCISSERQAAANSATP
jgi:DNA primase